MASKSDNVNSLIGSGSAFEGKFYIAGSLKIDGRFEGEIKTESELIIGEKGKVKTNIRANRVTVAGTVIGNIIATDEVKLLSTSRVLGDIVAPSVSMQKGVILKGKVLINAGIKKDVQKYVEDLYNSGYKLTHEGK